MTAEAESLRDISTSIMEGNPADWEACSRESQMTPSRASRIAVEMVLNDPKYQEERDATQVEGKRLAKRARFDPDTVSYDYTHQGFTNVPSGARPHNTPSSQILNTSTPGSTSTNAGPSGPTPAYEKCVNCGTFSLPADNPAWERRCKGCGQLFFPTQPLIGETRAYVQPPVSPYAPLPAINLWDFCGLARPGPSPLGFRAAPVPTEIRWISHNHKRWLIDDLGQVIDAAGELIDFDFYLIDPITKLRRMDVFGRQILGRAYPKLPQDRVLAPKGTDTHMGMRADQYHF